METKLAAVLAEASAGKRLNVSAVCRELGISRKHFYALRKRFAEGGLEAVMSGRSRRPKNSPGQTPATVEDQIRRWRKELAEAGLDNGARSIRYRLAAEGLSPLPAISTIHLVLRRSGLIVDQPQKRPKAADRRFAYPDPNACWQIDGTEWVLAGGEKVCVIKVIDDHSRAVLCMRVAPSENLQDTWACVSEAMDRHGVPVRVLSDRGGALNGHPDRQNEFRQRLRRRGVTPISSRGYHPQTCGKTERSHQSMQKWLRARPPADTPTQLQALLDEFTGIFNEQRPHQAHDGRTPQTVYTARTKVAPSGIPTDTPPTVTTVHVTARGEVRVGRHMIHVGRRWHRTLVTIIREDLNITILNGQEIIRKLVINPDVCYQGSGRPYPRSPKPHPRKVSPMS